MSNDPRQPELKQLAEQLISLALKAGAQEADAMTVRSQSIGIEVNNSSLEQSDRAEAVEVSLRVLIGGRQACVSASDHSAHTLEDMASRAVDMAKAAPIDDSLGLAEPDDLARDLESGALQLCDPGEEPAPATLQDMALRAEAAARSVQDISQVESASAGYSQRQAWLAASNGFSAGNARSSHGLSVVAITGEGPTMERDYAGESRVWAEDLPTPEAIGQLAAERTLARAGAKKPPTGPVPILYDQRVSASLISHLLSAINGSSVVRGATWLRNALGEPVLPDGFDLREDPRRPRYASSRIFDAEGLACQPRNIVKNGILKGWTLDLATARKLDMSSTASAARGLSSGPSPSNSNIILTQGQQSQDGLIADMGRGLIVTSMLGASINGTTGDYSRGAAGFWVENGRIAYPVNECTIAGNLRDMLMTLRAGNDAVPWRGIDVPSLLVEGMTVAGA